MRVAAPEYSNVCALSKHGPFVMRVHFMDAVYDGVSGLNLKQGVGAHTPGSLFLYSKLHGRARTQEWAGAYLCWKSFPIRFELFDFAACWTASGRFDCFLV